MHMGQDPRFNMPDGLLDLAADLETTWPARSAALRASGRPLNEGEPGPDPEPDPDPTPDPDPDPDPSEPQTFDAAYVKKLREEAAKHRREARDAQALVQQFEDKDKSDAQKLEERATTAEQRAVTSERELARTRVALRKGLTEAQAKRLIGDTEEDLEADADLLLAEFKTDDEGLAPPSSRPRERLRPGAAPSSEPEENDPAKLAALVPRL